MTSLKVMPGLCSLSSVFRVGGVGVFWVRCLIWFLLIMWSHCCRVFRIIAWSFLVGSWGIVLKLFSVKNV